MEESARLEGKEGSMERLDDVVDVLAGFALFADLGPAELEEVAHTLEEETFGEGQRVLRQGFKGTGLYVILDGEAVVRIDGTDRARLGRGDFFGEVSVLDGGPRTASVRAIDRLRCLGLANGTFRQVLLDYPLMAVNLLPQVIRRFRAVMTTGKGETA